MRNLNPSPDEWRTSDELHYLDEIGWHTNRGRHLADTDPEAFAKHRIELLRLYLKAAENRTEWGMLDKERVLAHVNYLLEIEGKEVEDPRDFFQQLDKGKPA